MKLPRTGILTVNSIVLPDPKSLTWGHQDLDSEEGAGRNANGKMFRDRIAVKVKLNLQWGPLETDDLHDILIAIKDVFFSVKYLDPYEGDVATKTMYAGDRSAPMYLKFPDGCWLWNGLSVNFIEQ